MRLSIRKGDPGYRHVQTLKKYSVFLDGKELFDCETADEERGFVIRTWKTSHPVTRQPVMQRSGLIYGVVEIKLKEEQNVSVQASTPSSLVAGPVGADGPVQTDPGAG